jgi:hypothetical protein
MDLAEKILHRLPLSKPQRRFLATLFTTILTVRGKVTFRNLSRYSELSEKTYSRQFAKGFDAIAFNRQLINETFGTESERIVAFDPCFIAKAGKKTYGRDSFWNGCHSRAEKGLEISAFSIVDGERHTGLTLSVQQTAPASASSSVPATEDREGGKREQPTNKANNGSVSKDETRIDAYLQHLGTVQPHLLESEKYVVVDGYFAKKKWVDGVEGFGRHTIGKLRADADMRYFYAGPKRPTGSGRQKIYDGKVDWQDLHRFHYVTCLDGIELYTLVLHHVSLQRTVRVVVVLDRRNPDKKR